LKLQEQMERGRINPKKVEAAYAGRRTEILQWLSKGFDHWDLRDEWFLATVALLDRAEVASHRFSHRHSFLIEGLTAALAALKQHEVESCDFRRLMLALGKGVSGKDVWADIIRTEMRLYRVLDYRVGIPTMDEFAVRIAIEVCLIARDTTPDWKGLDNMTIQMARPGNHLVARTTVPQHCLVVLLQYIIELSVIHQPAVIYQPFSPGVVALAALRLAMLQFGPLLAECTTVLKEHQQRLLKEGEAAQIPETMKRMGKLWCNPPADSEVVSKWRRRWRGSGDINRTLILLDPSPRVQNFSDGDYTFFETSTEDNGDNRLDDACLRNGDTSSSPGDADTTSSATTTASGSKSPLVLCAKTDDRADKDAAEADKSPASSVVDSECKEGEDTPQVTSSFTVSSVSVEKRVSAKRKRSEQIPGSSADVKPLQKKRTGSGDAAQVCAEQKRALKRCANV